MGAIVWSLENFVNTLLEIIIIKTGIVISEDNLIELLNEAFPDDRTFQNYHLRKNLSIRIRSEEFEFYCLEVRKKLGELEEDIQPYFINNIDKMLEWHIKGFNPTKVAHKLIDIMAAFNNAENPSCIDPNLVIEKAINDKIAPLPLILELLKSFIESQKLSNTIFPVEQINWDGGTELEELFTRESLPKKSSEFIEQKFINYLQANPEKLEFMHWRNFERLTAEFFKRENYEVELGSGTNDGGIDLRVFDRENTEKPYIIVQCKRHKMSHKVKIETVKSFYTDVEFEGATKGLIATTSRIAKGGKKVASIRKYPLQFAENEEIKDWVDKMKKR